MYNCASDPVSKIMTSDVICVSPNQTMEEVERVFNENAINHLPVVNENREILGMVSKSDVYKVSYGLSVFHNRYKKVYNQSLFRSLLVSDVMTENVASLSKDKSIGVAIGIFKENLFRALPIVEDKVVVGIVTPIDIISKCVAP
ncbi:MAG: CBS domain-containing protein [Saprospirales bacterium]|nr:MAG: CBS domain-containing protein [Saprospirales bacterium]